MEHYHIPVMGAVPSLTTAVLASPENPPILLVQSYAPYRRMAVQIADDGLDSFGLALGNYAIFRAQGWPNAEPQVCLIAFGDDLTLRLVEDIFASEPILRVAGEKIPAVRPHRNDLIVLGALDGVIDQEFASLEQIEPVFDWGC